MAGCPAFGFATLLADVRSNGVLKMADIVDGMQRCSEEAGLADAAQAAANDTSSGSARPPTGWRALHFAAAVGAVFS